MTNLAKSQLKRIENVDEDTKIVNCVQDVVKDRKPKEIKVTKRSEDNITNEANCP